MVRVIRFLAADAFEFVVHPVIHVEDEICDGVRKDFDSALRDVCVDVFEAGYRVNVSAFAAEKFG